MEYLPNFKNPCWYEARRGKREPLETSGTFSYAVRSSVEERYAVLVGFNAASQGNFLHINHSAFIAFSFLLDSLFYTSLHYF